MNELGLTALNKLDNYISQLGLTAKELFPYIVKQQYVWAGLGGFFFLLSILAFCFLPKIIRIGLKNKWSEIWFGVGIGVVINSIVLFSSLTYLVRIFNPEFYAVRQIIIWIGEFR